MRNFLAILQSPVIQNVLAWIYALSATLMSIFLQSLKSLVVSILLVVFFMVGDFLAGIFASRKAKERKKRKQIESSKLRWSAAKYAIYVFAFIGTLVAGILIHTVYCFNEGIEVTSKSYILSWTLSFLMGQMIFITWIEAISIVENLRLVYPDDKFLKGLHYVLLVDFGKLIPHFSKFLKEEKSKELDKINNTEEHEETINHP